jgi:hypothetical protein
VTIEHPTFLHASPREVLLLAAIVAASGLRRGC